MFYGSGGVDGIGFSTYGSQFSLEKKDSMRFRTVSKCRRLDHGIWNGKSRTSHDYDMDNSNSIETWIQPR